MKPTPRIILRMLMVAILITLLVSNLPLALALKLEIPQRHIFPGEEFQVFLADSGPTKYRLSLEFNGQKRNWEIHLGSGENLTETFTLKAPSSPGNYTLTYSVNGSQTRKSIKVEKPVLEIIQFRIEGNPGRNATIYLEYKLRPTREFSVSNVMARPDIIPKDGYIYDQEHSLARILNPGDTIADRFKIVMRNATPADLVLTVDYQFDGEQHSLVLYKRITFGETNYWPIIILLAILATTGYYIFVWKKTKTG